MTESKTIARYVFIYSAFRLKSGFNFPTPKACVKIRENEGGRMTIIDEYSSTCNDCGNGWISFVGVSTNTFGMTATQAENYLKYFAGLKVDSPFYCDRCGSFDISYENPDGYTKDGRTGPNDVAEALLPAIRVAVYQWKQRADIEEEVRDRELKRLSAYECSAIACAEKLAAISTEDERKAVLNELAETVREWDVNTSKRVFV